MKSSKNIFKLGAIFYLWISIVIMGCNKNTTESEGTPPEIPPASSFVMDFSDFSNADTNSASIQFNKSSLTYQNWWWAAFNVGVWNAIIKVGLAVPVAAFLESFKHQPAQQPDGTWVWSYNFIVNNVEHHAELHGSLETNATTWKMYISKEGFYQDFLWYTGEADLSLSQGSWTLNNKPADPNPLLQIEWHRNATENTGDIKYMNIVPNGPENGGYIFYGIQTSTTFDAFYDIFNKGKDNHTNIEWDRTTKEGRVKDPAHFSDSDWHCWDDQLQNQVCP